MGVRFGNKRHEGYVHVSSLVVLTFEKFITVPEGLYKKQINTSVINFSYKFYT